MDNHGLVQLVIPKIPHNLFGPSAQIGQWFGIFLKNKIEGTPILQHAMIK